MRIIKREHCPVSYWSGGQTLEIAIMPPESLYTNRDFLWRVSSATVEVEESDFTPLPDYQRWLVLLEGSLLLSHGGERPFQLEPYSVHAFDGGEATHALGCCRDFNLMLRKGICCGGLRVLSLPDCGTAEVRFESPLQTGLSCQALLLYCAAGEGMADDVKEQILLHEGDSVLTEHPGVTVLQLTARGSSRFIVAEVQH